MKHIIKTIIARILRAEAELIILKYKPHIVGVTGNVGKTSAKDAIYAVLKTTYNTRKSPKTLNTEFGVPLTILGCQSGWNNPFTWLYNILYGLVIIIFPYDYPKWLVLELGADRPGDILSLSRWLPLEFAVITSIGEVPTHIEFFKDKEELAKEKSHIIDALLPGGQLIINADDPMVMSMSGIKTHPTTTYGFTEKAQVSASGEQILYRSKDGKELPEGMCFTVALKNKTASVKVQGIFGKHHIYASLAAIALGNALKISIPTMVEALENYEKAPGRLRLIEGEKQTIILDDTYNASPLATEKAIETLAAIKVTGKKYLVMGDMLELGEFTIREHEKVGRRAAKVCDILVTAGQRAKYIADGAREAGMPPDKIAMFDTAVEAGKYIEPIIKPGDLILVKGSQGMRMERVVEEIMAHYEDAEKLLVRQEKEWKARE